MKKIVLFLLPLMMMAISCQDAIEIVDPNENNEGLTVFDVLMKMPEIVYDEQTKVTMDVISTGLSFAWSDGDKTGVYSTDGGFSRFTIASGYDGKTDATFSGSGFALENGKTYYAFFPYALSSDDKTAIPLAYSGQSVSGNDDKVSPMSKVYMWSSDDVSVGKASFSFHHIGAFMRMQLTLPVGTAIDQIDLVPMYGEVPQTMTIDISTASPAPAVTTESTVMSITATGLTVPDGGIATVWAAMPPQSFATDHFAVLIHSGEKVYAARFTGSAFNPGKAYNKALTPLDIAGDPGYGFTTVTATGIKQTTESVESGQYSGIAYMGGKKYAVVDDKLNGGGIIFFDITINDDGTIGDVSKDNPIPTGTSGSLITDMDNEGVAYVPSTGKLYVSAEKDQSIKEYNLDGTPTGYELNVPSDMAPEKLQTSNEGFEALTFNASTGLFWTTTEAPLKKDGFRDGLLRLQSFGLDRKASGRYLYQMDAPTKTASEAAAAYSYAFGVSAMAALDDGRIVVLEREVYVPNTTSPYIIMAQSFTNMKLYVVKPLNDNSGILRKTLLTQFSTDCTNAANYEGMCVGPTLSDGSQTLVLIPDSQGGPTYQGINLFNEWVKVIKFK